MKRMTIEELLTWAYVHELPKGGGVDGLANMNSAWRMIEASSWGKILGFAELNTLIDAGPGDASNFLIEQGEPHEDAVTVGRAVADLAAFDVVFPDGWNPLGDWPADDPTFVGLAGDAIMRTVERFHRRDQRRRGREIVSLVVGTAVLARDPPWEAEPAKVRMMERGGKPAWFVQRILKHEDGHDYPVEVDGFNARTQRPARGAFRKYEFSHDPIGDILSRLDHQIWVAALNLLVRGIGPQLVGHRLLGCDRSATPWLARDMAGVSLETVAVGEGRKKTASRC